MQDIFSIPFKKTDSVEIVKPLKSFISSTYSKNTFKEYEAVLTTIQNLRGELKNPAERNEGTLLALQRYCAHLQYLSLHFPLDGSEIKINSSWWDAFSKRKFSQSHPVYERIGTVFNMAAVSTQMAAIENRLSPEGAKNAAKLLQSAAGLFLHIREDLHPKLVERIPIDISADSLRMLSDICLACAQMCIYEKAVRDKMKSSIVAKLCAQTAALFQSASSAAASSLLYDNFDKSVHAYLHFQRLFYEARTQHHAAAELHEQDKLGDEISRLLRAQALLREASAHTKNAGPYFAEILAGFSAPLEKDLAGAQRDNDKVFHCRVPAFETLPEIEKKSMVKPTPIADFGTVLSLADPFAKLVPVPIMDASNKYTEKAKQLVGDACRTAREHSEALKAKLVQMNLPGAILAAEKKDGLPDALFEKIQKTQTAGGIAVLHERFGKINQLGTEARDSCACVQKMLGEEEDEDTAAKMQFGGRWTRIPSSTLNVNLKKSIDEVAAKLQAADSSDAVVRGKYDENASVFEKLSWPKGDLDSLIPQDFSSTEDNAGNRAFQDLKSLLAEFEEAEKKIESVTTEINALLESDTTNIQTALLSVGVASAESTCAQEIKKYDSLIGQLKTTSDSEDETMTKIEVANEAFVAHRKNNEALAKKEEVIQSLYSGCNKFDEIMANTGEGISFYSAVIDLLNKHAQRVGDFCFARRAEKADHMSVLAQELAGLRIAENPYPPSQQQQQTAPAPTTSSAPAPSAAAASGSVPPSLPTPPPVQFGGHPSYLPPLPSGYPPQQPTVYSQPAHPAFAAPPSHPSFAGHPPAQPQFAAPYYQQPPAPGQQPPYPGYPGYAPAPGYGYPAPQYKR